ncbi:uncharacterized protein TrAtP1_005613 [Trichoderma atroviride]|uniref:uncharacterized protein n=1 Tax=Hypocrea atroviridis TaxID=63577 RepID=UPI00331825A9|nr:hypothetical protein TrAtP1_005613 [Trichoderma atroviride]
MQCFGFYDMLPDVINWGRTQTEYGTYNSTVEATYEEAQSINYQPPQPFPQVLTDVFRLHEGFPRDCSFDRRWNPPWLPWSGLVPRPKRISHLTETEQTEHSIPPRWENTATRAPYLALRLQ